MRRRYLINGQTHDVVVTCGVNGGFSILRAGRRLDARAEALSDGRQRLMFDGQAHTVWIAASEKSVFVHSNANGAIEIETVDAAGGAGQARAGASDTLVAPMPGTVIAVPVAEGDRVSVGQPLMVIESMKLETTLSAPREARVKAVHFGVGATFGLKAILVTLQDL
ncbi:biotin/lipoyl-containing protein [Polaromonas sp.]|jgi:acetyl/propionyl-CoA carboxylase alpha subunit|uniref:acetyl-CoA carboxylase biotin carboxyl carrier protein subunit n=1 Tax=Polaromonas sp. TaxID=1869339 RepID=UPI0024899A46|nr:biotin/lipoyl-containing protein [Polaromonas sp.]MDI1339691.1 biotin/lipoyl-binding protein [Polaromonas sp.]